MLDCSFALGLLLQQIGSTALRAGTGNRAVVERELALRIARAGIEDAAAGAALDSSPSSHVGHFTPVGLGGGACLPPILRMVLQSG